MRACTIAPAHIVQGSSVTYNVQPVRRQSDRAVAAWVMAITSACAVGSRSCSRWLYAAAFDEDESSNDYFLQADVRDEIRQAYALSLGSPRHRATPLSNVAANYFAYTLARCGEWDFARHECKRIGQFPAYFPWCYGGEPVDFYVRTRAALFETAAV